MYRSATIALFALVLWGCGDVHWVTKHAEISPPVIPPPAPKEREVETFKYAVPTGVLNLIFAFHNLKSMEPVVDRIRNSIDGFHDLFWNEASHYDRIKILTAVDDFSGTNEMTYLDGRFKNLWQIRAESALTQSLAAYSLSIGTEPRIPIEPFSMLAALSRYALGADIKETQWTHILYFRDFDISAEGPEEKVVKQGQESLKKNLERSPLSPFRNSITRFVYLNRDTACAPSENRIGRKTQELFSAFAGKNIELCGINRKTFREAAADIHNFNRRMVLAHEPKADSLELKIAGIKIPRHLYYFVSGANEVRLSDGISTPATGETIEVSYEPL